jgi:hypothetical protein
VDVTACPEEGCDQPAEILDRTMIESTDEPVEHVRVACLGGHRFLMPAEMLLSRRRNRSQVIPAVVIATRDESRLP